VDQTAHFISEFCRWAGETGMPQNRRARLSAALRRAINVELPRRDGRLEAIIRSLENSEGLRYSYNSETVWLYYSVSNRLIAGTLSPGWRSGWAQISRDAQIQHIVMTPQSWTVLGCF
jgi:hypothetical protein